MSKNKKSGKKKSTKNIADVTINDFANSAVCKNRLKKSSNNVVTTIVNELVGEEDKTWEERDFDGDFVKQENEDGSVSYVIAKVEPRRRRKTISSSESNNNKDDSCGRQYPIDIWYLISEYIRPEDVGRFAGICRTSYEVASGAKFWFSLYKRYYVSVPNLPERLQPENLVRKYSLRTSVIRALHYMYTPFVTRVKSIMTFEKHPDVLRKRQCILMWHQREKTQWIYFFKMKENLSTTLPHYRKNETDEPRPDILEMLDDVSANSDNNCQMLQVTCTHFIAVPPVLGLTLTSVSLNLSQGFRHYRLQLGFGTGIYLSNAQREGSDCTNIVLDPVINVKVLDWWHPLYPHCNNLYSLLNQVEVQE